MARRGWEDSTKCCFCNSNETIQHLFFDCPLARFVWNAIFIAFGIHLPTNVANLLGNWFYGVLPRLRAQILVGVAAFVGRFGYVEMMWSLMASKLTHFCR